VKSDIDLLREQIAALNVLIRQPGYALMMEEFKKAAAHSYTEMTTNPSPHEAAKAIGSYHACLNVTAWAGRMKEALEHQLEMTIQSEKRYGRGNALP